MHSKNTKGGVLIIIRGDAILKRLEYALRQGEDISLTTKNVYLGIEDVTMSGLDRGRSCHVPEQPGIKLRAVCLPVLVPAAGMYSNCFVVQVQ